MILVVPNSLKGDLQSLNFCTQEPSAHLNGLTEEKQDEYPAHSASEVAQCPLEHIKGFSFVHPLNSGHSFLHNPSWHNMVSFSQLIKIEVKLHFSWESTHEPSEHLYGLDKVVHP